MSVTTMSCFRLFDLPLDLLEFLTLYFEGKEAVKLLTVSSDFHDIFARSVWRTIGYGTIRVAEPTRSRAFARYGHLVRSIDLFCKLHLDFDSHNWAQLFPNATSMRFDILPDMKDCDKQAFMDAIAGLHGLRSLEIQMDTNTPPFDLETLTKVVVARHRDPSKQSLQELTMFFGIRSEEEEEDDDDDDDVEEVSWNDLCPIVQILSPLRPPIKLQIDTCRCPDVAAPTPAQMETLRPYLASLPTFEKVEDEHGCKALRNRQIFSPVGTRNDPLVYDRLNTLLINICCTVPHLFDYSDFTPAKFPVMKSMEITEKPCRHQTAEGAVSAIPTLILQKWPKLKDLSVHSELTLSTLDTLIELNPLLTRLNTRLCHNTNDSDCVFMLEHVTGHLPHITTLTLRCDFPILMDSDWLHASSLVDIHSSKLTYVSISRFRLTPRLFEVLLALPNLRDVAFWGCVLAEPELIMDIFKKQRQTDKENAAVGVRRLAISAPMNNNNWSAELVLEMIASLPHLESCRIYGTMAFEDAIKKEYPNLYRWL
ncbi:hypothetical protein GQ42DRAFT_38420 [Ramicandelaber brevisporus]|nr:hypothetical protein GQ42DRAFT_38420 [Ramicandelaber brevisporus]